MPIHPIELLTPEWPCPANVKAFASTREGGVSTGALATLNLSDRVGDDENHVATNRERVTLACGLNGDFRWLHQVHGTRVVHWTGAGEATQADAIWTDSPGQGCLVSTADCLPLLLCSRAGTVVAAAHCGWRGLAGGIIESVLAALPVPPEEVLAWMGAAIGPRVYEVGNEVRDTFLARGRFEGAFEPSPNGRWQADLYRITRDTLAAEGVGSVHGGQFCTYSEPKRFFSYRRDGLTGRMVSAVWIDAVPVPVARGTSG